MTIRQIRETLTIKKGRETKNNSFLVSKQESIREEEEEEEEEEEGEGGAKLRYGYLKFGMEFEYEIVRFCPKTTRVWIARVFFGY